MQGVARLLDAPKIISRSTRGCGPFVRLPAGKSLKALHLILQYRQSNPR
jgi:hypothetical protein